MNASNRDALSSVVARHRGRRRMRATTAALGSAGLITAGAVAYTHQAPALTTAAPATSPATAPSTAPAAQGPGTVHATSGGSAVTTTPASSVPAGSQATAPAASSGSATTHATSGGS